MATKIFGTTLSKNAADTSSIDELCGVVSAPDIAVSISDCVRSGGPYAHMSFEAIKRIT